MACPFGLADHLLAPTFCVRVLRGAWYAEKSELPGSPSVHVAQEHFTDQTPPQGLLTCRLLIMQKGQIPSYAVCNAATLLDTTIIRIFRVPAMSQALV